MFKNALYCRCFRSYAFNLKKTKKQGRPHIDHKILAKYGKLCILDEDEKE